LSFLLLTTEQTVIGEIVAKTQVFRVAIPENIISRFG